MFNFRRLGGGNYSFALTILALVFLLTSNAVPKEKNNYQGLLPVSGVKLVIKNCTVCHSADIIL